MRLLLASLMLAGAARGQTPQHRLFEQPNLPHSSLAFFEAFRGAEASCQCAAVTGAKGEVLTYARNSAQTCTKTVGVEPQQISNGDLVSCPANAPVVMPGPDGTGVSGLLVEAAGANSLIQSNNFTSGWTSYFSGVAESSLTPTYATAPDGTLTAWRFVFASTTGSQRSARYQSNNTGTLATARTIYLRGNGSDQTMDICAGGDGCTTCTAASGYWSRCYRQSSAASQTLFMIGCTSDVKGSACTGGDVLIWEAQSQINTPVATSQIHTDGAAATRVAVVPSMPVTLAGNVLSVGETWLLPTTVTTSASAFTVSKDASNYVVGYNTGGAFVCDFVIGGVTSSVTGPAMTAGAAARVACTYDAAGRSACVNGTCTTTAGALTLFTGASSFYFGTRTATGNESRAVVKRGCLDQGSASRCVL